MNLPDLNLLYTLDALLRTGSVAAAARELKLSPSAMSRSLARLREATGDPLLVRAGRGLVPTPRALQLRDHSSSLLQQVQAMLRPAHTLNLSTLQRTFTLRCSEGFVENFGAALIRQIQEAAPGVRLHFINKQDNHNTPLRDGSIDLETGVVSSDSAPELRLRALYQDHFVGVVRPGHPLCEGLISAERYAAGQHVLLSRQGQKHGQTDDALAALGLTRPIVAIVSGFAAALALVRDSDLIATVPAHHTATLRQGLHSFALPLTQPAITVSLFWHPRLDADPAHRWLRERIHHCCAAAPYRTD